MPSWPPWQQGTRWWIWSRRVWLQPGTRQWGSRSMMNRSTSLGSAGLARVVSIGKPLVSSTRVLTHRVGGDRVEGLGGEVDAFAVGGAVFAAVGHDRELELPGGFDVGVGATQLDEPVGVAMLE